MGELWRPAVALASVSGAVLWLFLAWASRKRKCIAALEPVAAELGLAFHGDSFRGRIQGHAVRGDAIDEIPGREFGKRSSFFAPFSFGERVVRIRIELTTPDAPPPQSPKALAAARRELKGSERERGACEAALHGTEIVFVLRGDAIDPPLARRVVEKAIDTARPE